MSSFALPGNHPELTFEEIRAVLGWETAKIVAGVGIFDGEAAHLAAALPLLGGTPKAGEVIGNVKTADDLVELAVKTLLALPLENKLFVGFSVYGPKANAWRPLMGDIGRRLKDRLKDEGRSARIVVSREPTLSTVVIRTNKLLTRGAEFVLLADGDDVVVGRTLDVQDPFAWNDRDMKPYRNAKQGMMPPKLARILINLAGGAQNKTVYDPFVGSGTTLIEAHELGAKRLIGSDHNPQAVRDTAENCDAAGIVAETFISDARAISTHLPGESVDAIITESYLGKPRQGNEPESVVQAIVNEVDRLYRDVAQSLADTLKTGGALIFTSPVHVVGKKIIEPDVRTAFDIPSLHLTAEPLLYRRPDQHVGRRIWRFEKR